MLDVNTLNRCLDILAILNDKASREDKISILELGHILKQELMVQEKWNKNHNKVVFGRNLDVNKLIEDNTQLFNENQNLINDVMKLKSIIDTKIPFIERQMMLLDGQATRINNGIERMSKIKEGII